MTLKNKKQLIISLILDDLIHTRLIEGLKALGFTQEWYCLELSDTVIGLMGFRGRQNELMYEYYLERRAQAQLIDLSDGNAEMQKLATSIYRELLLLESESR